MYEFNKYICAYKDRVYKINLIKFYSKIDIQKNND